jgi:hypothetical protein
MIVVGSLVVGLVLFFVFWWSPTVGRWMAGAVHASGLGWCAWVGVRDRQRLWQVLQPMVHALVVWFLVSLLFVMVVFAADTGAGQWNANARFWPVRWSSDNELPLRVGEALFSERSIEGLLGPWHVSDRPPLQTGMYLLVRPLASVLVPGSQESRVSWLHTAVGVVLNTLWAYAGFLLARHLGLRRRSSLSVVIILLFTPFAIFNSSYVWPKMLSGALALLATAQVVIPALKGKGGDAKEAFPWCAALAALALLSHGGIIFYLVGLGLWVMVMVGVPGWRVLGRALLVGVLLMVPWMLWQKLVDPPGNALVKSAFAGTNGFDEPQRGVIDTVLEAYGETGWKGWLESKRRAVVTIVAGRPAPAGIERWDQRRRWRDFFFIGPSFAVFFLLGAAALVGRTRARGPDAQGRWCLRACRHLLVIALAGLAVSALVQWRPEVIHHNSYGAFLLLVLAATIGGVSLLGRLGMLMLAASIAVTIWTWLIEPLPQMSRLDPAGVVGCTVLSCLGLWIVYDSFSDPESWCPGSDDSSSASA